MSALFKSSGMGRTWKEVQEVEEGRSVWSKLLRAYVSKLEEELEGK